MISMYGIQISIMDEQKHKIFLKSDSHQPPLTLWLRYSNLELHMIYHRYWALYS